MWNTFAWPNNVHDWLYVDGNPVGIKAALSILGYCKTDVRLALAPMASANFNQLKKEIDKALTTEPVKA